MEELLKEERMINNRIKELSDYDETLLPEINTLYNRVGVLWKNYSILTLEQQEEFTNKSRQLVNLRNKVRLETKKELDDLYLRLQTIYKMELELTPPCIQGDRLELKSLNDDICTDYMILLKNTTEIVGKITYRGYHHSNFLGDIGFTINSEYRGNGYAYEALCLLSNILYDNNISDFWITAFKDNYASVKTIMKYGPKELEGCYNSVSFYECPTRKYIYSNKEVIR